MYRTTVRLVYLAYKPNWKGRRVASLLYGLVITRPARFSCMSYIGSEVVKHCNVSE